MTRILSSRFRYRFATIANALLLIALAVFLRPLTAQVVGSSISGTVTDSSGAIISGATVVVRNTETGTQRKLITDAIGRYAAPSLPVGNYQITVTKEGFGTQVRTGIRLAVAQTANIDLALEVGTVEQRVTVAATPATVNTGTQQVSGLVDERQVKELPLNGRSYDTLIMLNPGVVNYTAQRSGSIGTSNSSVGNMFSITGHRPQDNLFLLNGIEYTGASLINVTPGGTSGQLLGVDAVREFNVAVDGYGAEYGKRAGAQISIITASGSNQLHGGVYEFLRNSALDARNYFDQARIPEFQRNVFGGSLGGPIRKDKLFLFGNYEGYRQNLGLSDVTLVPDNQARNGYVPNSAGVETYVGVNAASAPLLNLWPTQNGAELLTASGQPSGIAYAYSSPPQHIREDFGTSRLDANLTPRDLLFGVYTVDDSIANTPSANPYSTVEENLREQVVSLQEQHVFSPSFLNTARIGFSRASYFFTGIVPVAGVNGWVGTNPIGAIVISGSTASNGASAITGAGANTGSNNSTVRNLFTYDDHIFWTHGHHQIEAGGWLQRVQANDGLAQNQYGQASFSTLTTFLQGTVATFTVVPAPTRLGWRSYEGAAFASDTVRITPRLELRAGFRLESTNGWNESQGRASVYTFTNGVISSTPTVGSAGLPTNRAKFLPNPRLGLAWDPFNNHHTVIHAGVGLYHSLLDTLDYRFDQAAPYNTTSVQKNIALSTIHIAPGSAAVGIISPSNVQPDISTPAVVDWNLKIEQQIAASTSFSIGYVGYHGYHQVQSEDLNEPAVTACSTCFGGIRFASSTDVNPAVANTTSWVSHGVSSYNGLEADVRRSFSHGLQFRGVYTWSKSLDDGSAWNTSVSGNTPAFVEYPGNPKLDWGPSATDMRNIAAINATWELPFGAGHARFQNQPQWFTTAVSGWSISGILQSQSGFPFSPQLGYNPAGNGDTRNPIRPNLNTAFTGALYPHTVSEYFNPNAFTTPATGTLGNASRDSLQGPHLNEFDGSLTRNAVLHNNLHLQFRAEFFNLFNHANFSTPNPVVYTSATTLSPTAGVITATSTTSRQIQFGAKLLF